MDTLDICAMIRPLPDEGIFRDEGYFCWGPNVVKGDDGKYYMAYSRWPEETKQAGWLTDSEIALAAADQPNGPYEHLKVLLKGRGPGHWDELMAHNRRLLCLGAAMDTGWSCLLVPLASLCQ